MQESARDNPGRCYAIHAEPGDIVIVPPYWAHATISSDPEIPLTFGAWCDREYGFEYDEVRAHKGLAWYPLLDDKGNLRWHFNEHYIKSDLIEKEPGEYELFDLEQGKCIYAQFEKDHSKFLFVPEPYRKEALWKNFMP